VRAKDTPEAQKWNYDLVLSHKKDVFALASLPALSATSNWASKAKAYIGGTVKGAVAGIAVPALATVSVAGTLYQLAPTTYEGSFGAINCDSNANSCSQNVGFLAGAALSSLTAAAAIGFATFKQTIQGYQQQENEKTQQAAANRIRVQQDLQVVWHGIGKHLKDKIMTVCQHKDQTTLESLRAEVELVQVRMKEMETTLQTKLTAADLKTIFSPLKQVIAIYQLHSSNNS
jgi:hypothetical protein